MLSTSSVVGLRTLLNGRVPAGSLHGTELPPVNRGKINACSVPVRLGTLGLSAVEVGGVAGADGGQESCRRMIRSALRLRVPVMGRS